MNRDDLLYDLTLAMLRLTSWEEQGLDGPVLRAWKSYDWGTIDRLVDDGLVSATPRAKSAYLTDEGRARAEEVVRLLERAFEGDSGGESQDCGSAIDAALPQGRGIKVFKFRVELRLWPEHPCWREILVPASGTFIDLHQVIQGAFLWWDYHLMHFDVVVRGRTVEITYEDMIREREDFAVVGEVLPEMRAAETLPLSDIFPRCRTAVYEYDYGDGWEHDVTLVEVIRDYRGELPVCTAGEGDAPPEDVGGPGDSRGSSAPSRIRTTRSTSSWRAGAGASSSSRSAWMPSTAACGHGARASFWRNGTSATAIDASPSLPKQVAMLAS